MEKQQKEVSELYLLTEKHYRVNALTNLIPHLLCSNIPFVKVRIPSAHSSIRDSKKSQLQMWQPQCKKSNSLSSLISNLNMKAFFLKEKKNCPKSLFLSSFMAP